MESLPPGFDLCSIAAGPHPDGLPPNFVNPETLAPAIITISVFLTVLAVFICSGRFWVNRHSFKWGDGTMHFWNGDSSPLLQLC
jgi:hypothetical protein